MLYLKAQVIRSHFTPEKDLRQVCNLKQDVTSMPFTCSTVLRYGRACLLDLKCSTALRLTSL